LLSGSSHGILFNLFLTKQKEKDWQYAAVQKYFFIQDGGQIWVHKGNSGTSPKRIAETKIKVLCRFPDWVQSKRKVSLVTMTNSITFCFLMVCGNGGKTYNNDLKHNLLDKKIFSNIFCGAGNNSALIPLHIHNSNFYVININSIMNSQILDSDWLTHN